MATLEEIQAMRGSWEDISSQAEQVYGPVGRQIATLLRCEGMGSKGRLSDQIELAGFPNVRGVLEWAGQPYSSNGLREAALAAAKALADEVDASSAATG